MPLWSRMPLSGACACAIHLSVSAWLARDSICRRGCYCDSVLALWDQPAQQAALASRQLLASSTSGAKHGFDLPQLLQRTSLRVLRLILHGTESARLQRSLRRPDRDPRNPLRMRCLRRCESGTCTSQGGQLGDKSTNSS